MRREDLSEQRAQHSTRAWELITNGEPQSSRTCHLRKRKTRKMCQVGKLPGEIQAFHSLRALIDRCEQALWPVLCQWQR